MVHKICSILLAATLSLAGLSTPVRADDDFNKFLAALAVMGIIGVVADKARDNPPHVSPKPVTKPKSVKYWGNNDRWLPKQCYTQYETSKGTASYFDKKCLTKYNKMVHSLPRQCERVVWTSHGKRKLFSPNCLSQHGYYINRRDY